MPPANWHQCRSYTIIIHNTFINNSSHLRNNRLPRNNPLARGNTHIPRILCLARGNTHIPRTSVSSEENSHFQRTSHSHYVWRPQGFGSLPNSMPRLWKTPYTTILDFPAVHVTYTPLYPARAGIPVWLGGLTSTLRTRCARPAGTGTHYLFISVIDQSHRLSCA